ncbi:sensor histidine kinase [Nonomuraea jabiensis]|uniref:sensor histidine kinase n=1 Tax=Nonomuraea jabiensis TaxID=882448 RepID=UPI0036AC13AA
MRRGWQPPAIDAAAAVATAVGILVAPALTGGELSWSGTVPLAVCLAALQPAARRWPVAVLAASAIIVLGLNAAGQADAGWVWPASVAYVRVALRGHTVWAAAIGTLCLITGSALEGELLLGEVLWLCLLLTAALAYRAHRRLNQESAARQRAAQRVAMAQDVHDIIAHTLAVLGIQLTVAQDAFDDSSDEARQALRLAQQVRAEAVAELRSLIGALREDATAAERLSVLVDHVRASGVDVALRQEGDHADLPGPVAWGVYRVVQEALTNIVKHAHAHRAEIVLTHASGEVRLSIADDGRATPPASDGYGITGMHERVTALGGTLTAGPAEGGFTVQAVIPTSVSPAKEGPAVPLTTRSGR